MRLLVDLHAVDWQAAGLGEIGHPDGYLRRQVSGWIERYRMREPGPPTSKACRSLSGWLDNAARLAAAQRSSTTTTS